MSLEKYRWGRLVVMNPHDTAYDAARAMESNHVGAIIVQEKGSLVGIVTDRDLAIRVTGFQLDPTETELRDIMSVDPAWLPLSASEDDALSLLSERHVRRAPIVDDGHTVGMITLDDLILSQRVPPSKLAEIVRGQLAEPAALKPSGQTHPVRNESPTAAEDREARRRAHAEQTFHEFKQRLQAASGLDTTERALAAFEVVASALVRRLTAAEASDFVAQLPSVLRDRLLELPAGPDREVTRGVIDSEMAARLDLEIDEARRLVSRIGAIMGSFVDEGELEHVDAQLPPELKGLTRPA